MTITQCRDCKEYVENVVPCPKCGLGASVLTIPFALPVEATPVAVGAEIRRLLLTLRHPDHKPNTDGTWSGHYGTDALRAEALDRAGICWKAPGELAPGCTCPRKYA